LTDEWHPTQMLADFLTTHEASNLPYDEFSFASLVTAVSTWAARCW
jgi:ornithine carbamoyltransferase